MNLKFMKHWPERMGGAETDFTYKIWSGIKEQPIDEHFLKWVNSKQSQDEKINALMDFTPKIHTIRKGNRWKAGDKIHLQIWEGKPWRSKVLQFAPVMECVSVQDIVIDHYQHNASEAAAVHIDGRWFGDFFREAEDSEGDVMNLLARNDGFTGAKHFAEYFNENLEGQIIHWTPFKY